MHKLAYFIPILVFTISCKKTENNTPSGPPPKKPTGVEAWLVSSVALEEKLRLPANIVANEFTEIRPEINGKIQNISFSEGQKITKGQLLFKLNDADAQARLSKLKVQKEILLNTERRQKELLQLQAIGQQEYDLSLLQLRIAEADIKILETEIEKHHIRAPFSGTIGIRKISPGSVVSPSSILAEVADLNQAKVQFALPEKYIPSIKIGDHIFFKTEGNDSLHKAKIESFESSLDPITRSLNVSASIKNNSNKFFHGLFAEVILNIRSKTSGIMVPSHAVIPQARDKKVILLKNGVAEFRSVTLGVRDSTSVEIIQGIGIGDTLITTGLMGIKPGAPVHIVQLFNVQ
ncbi:MAG: efflux RND transporter periplasmic adaptor subunit [Saprospiraceae bacterium]|nr:efflux RND transporter periplasmic adaptor subunit [Saprospiraceae bacterium]